MVMRWFLAIYKQAGSLSYQVLFKGLCVHNRTDKAFSGKGQCPHCTDQGVLAFVLKDRGLGGYGSSPDVSFPSFSVQGGQSSGLKLFFFMSILLNS